MRRVTSHREFLSFVFEGYIILKLPFSFVIFSKFASPFERQCLIPKGEILTSHPVCSSFLIILNPTSHTFQIIHTPTNGVSHSVGWWNGQSVDVTYIFG